MAAKTLIIGCGYIGLPLALELKARGHEITAWVHSAETAVALVPHQFSQVIIGNVADVHVWGAARQPYDVVIQCASSGRGGEAAYTDVFSEGAARINELQPEARKLLVSSTSVYGQATGEVVTESSDANPSTATGKILREAEMIALRGGAMIARSSGIYGPGRAVLFEKLRRGAAVIEGDGARWLNQIHRLDLVAALAHLVKYGAARQIYNASDDTPVMQRDYYAWCAEFLGKPLPPVGPVDTARKRGLTNKCVSNAKLRLAGWAPIYPSFREGIAADHSPR